MRALTAAPFLSNEIPDAFSRLLHSRTGYCQNTSCGLRAISDATLMFTYSTPSYIAAAAAAAPIALDFFLFVQKPLMQNKKYAIAHLLALSTCRAERSLLLIF